MRKRIINPAELQSQPLEEDGLNIEALAEVDITSEHPDHPIEFALLPGQALGWQAAESGRQIIRLRFSIPQLLERIWLRFEETRVERTQEYALHWSSDGGKSYQEIVRQQWNFSPDGATLQEEDHHVSLEGVTVLELSIIPEINGGDTVASLSQMRLF